MGSSSDCSIEASDLGWAPGEWDSRVFYQGEEFGLMGVDYAPETDGRCINGWLYVAPSGRSLLVIND